MRHIVNTSLKQAKTGYTVDTTKRFVFISAIFSPAERGGISLSDLITENKNILLFSKKYQAMKIYRPPYFLRFRGTV
jgi:hypothetical protein